MVALLSRRGRRKPAPRHALDQRHLTGPEGPQRDNGLLAILVVLVLTSGFVVGTTAAFTAATSNPGNIYSTQALNVPTNLQYSVSGNTTTLTWDRPSNTNFTGEGYRITYKDFQAIGTNGALGTCSSTGYATQLGTGVVNNNGITTHTYADSTPTDGSHLNYVDGREWCYQVSSATPCCPLTANGWLSQGNNPATTPGVVVGFTQISATPSPNGGVADGLFGQGDALVINFNQDVNTTSQPTGTVCAQIENAKTFTVNGVSSKVIWFGLSGTSGVCNTDPGHETLSGFAVAVPAASLTSSDTKSRRFNMADTWSNCSSVSACKTLTMTVGTKTVGATTTASITANAALQVLGTQQSTSLRSASSPFLNFCNIAGAANNLAINGITVKNDPTNGRCVMQITSGW